MPGAFVISLDFELLWGVRDLYPNDGGPYRANLLGARQAIPKMLELFEEFQIRATWAAVGMLFANSRCEIEQCSPAARPVYRDARLDPYAGAFGDGERDEPIRYAPSLLKQIANAPGQEIGSHTFSHYYPLEPGHDDASFRADLEAAVAIAPAWAGRPRSLVIPRNQLNLADMPIIAEAGFTSVRANARGWPHRACPGKEFRAAPARILRLMDSYLPLTGDQIDAWSDIRVIDGVTCIPASHFVRPCPAHLRGFERLRFHRLSSTIRTAARYGGLCHLWWHPHNFGLNQPENFAFLRRLLEVFRDCRERYGMVSMTMSDVASALSPARTARPSS